MLFRLATADQLKIIFLFALRSSASALATQPIRYHSSAAADATTSISSDPSNTRLARPTTESTVSNGHINFRMARRSDIPSIQRCNLATLPENYNEHFYLHHLRSWPELALVMEYVPSSPSSSHGSDDYYNNNNERQQALDRRGGNLFSNYDRRREEEALIVGYVLGKVDEVSIESQILRTTSTPLPRSTVSTNNENNFGVYPPYTSSYQKRTELLGHVTSLAILHNYRRKGLAAQLMKQLHYQMHNSYDADAVGLHVRVSNKAAAKLYVENSGYIIADVIKDYYQDGEDAYFMRKELAIDSQQQQVEEQNVHDNQVDNARGLRKLWAKSSRMIRNELLLPRRIDLVDNPNRGVEQQYRRASISYAPNDTNTMYYQVDVE